MDPFFSRNYGGRPWWSSFEMAAGETTAAPAGETRVESASAAAGQAVARNFNGILWWWSSFEIAAGEIAALETGESGVASAAGETVAAPEGGTVAAPKGGTVAVPEGETPAESVARERDMIRASNSIKEKKDTTLTIPMINHPWNMTLTEPPTYNSDDEKKWYHLL